MTNEQHLKHMAEFIRGVELSGGTTPHVGMTVAMMDRLEDDPLEQLWFAGCYALTYNWPTAERIFLEQRPQRLTQESFYRWSVEHWDGIFLRKERKAVYRKEFFAESAASYAAFAKWLLAQDTWPADHNEAFKMFTGRCRYMGRYIAIRWLEVMRRVFADCSGWSMTDVMNDGGEHPRKALALIYPEDSAWLLGGNSRDAISRSDRTVQRCLTDLATEYGVTTDYYQLQSLLCEYKQSWLGRKQYPGKSIDTEMDYFRKVTGYWGRDDSSFYDIRSDIFPSWSLGEVSGWEGVRPELGGVLTNYGYTWSDAIYDYTASRGDLSEPVLHDINIQELL